MSHLQVIQPVDPDVQKSKQLSAYNKVRDYQVSIFYGRTKSKILNIMESVRCSVYSKSFHLLFI